MRQALDIVPNALLQFHGREEASACLAWGRPFLKAVAMTEGVDLLDWESRYRGAAGLLADAPSAGFGGAGRVFDWRRLPAAAQRRLPLVLAGGLDAANVAEAIGNVRPHGVDVSSGVEESPGLKSLARMRGFVAAVRDADAQDGAA